MQIRFTIAIPKGIKTKQFIDQLTPVRREPLQDFAISINNYQFICGFTVMNNGHIITT